jgi:transcriptional regulator with XRE-family HTH domain
MRFSKTTFRFGREFGARLRDLRQRRGLSLRQLALLMDRHQPGSFNLMAKLERGDLKYPSINLVADYLRACGANFDDLKEVLDPYTSRRPVLYEKGDRKVAELLKALPPGEQRAMLRWEQATTATREAKAAAGPAKKKARVTTDRERVLRIVWSFIHANWNEVLEQKLYEALLRLRPPLPRSERKAACQHGRRMFGILTRHFATDRRRSLALAHAEQQARDDGFSDAVTASLLAAATEAHSELLLSGRLDWEPTDTQIVKAAGRAPKVERAETRLELDELRPRSEYEKAVWLVRSMVKSAGNAHLEKLRLDFETRKHYLPWLDRLVAIAVEHDANSAEWQAEVERAAPRLHDPAVARAVAAIAADAFSRWKKRIPTEPEVQQRCK